MSFVEIFLWVFSFLALMNQPLRFLLIGAGGRGHFAYGKTMLQFKEQARFIAVAEPIPERRSAFAADHNISPEFQFDDWKPLLDANIPADAVFICTQDALHKAPAIYAMKKGYHVLLEKPMSNTLEDCLEIVKTAKDTKRQLQICHVLRYTKFFRTIYDAIQSGKLGQIITYTHRENVAHFHMAHSYVRGNWRNLAESSPMILAKCCHDLDIIYWFAGAQCDKLASFGKLAFFKKDHAPPESTDRCCTCPLKDTCEFSAYSIYAGKPLINAAASSPKLGMLHHLAKIQKNYPGFVKFLAKFIAPIRRIVPWKEWPTTIITTDLSEAGIRKAIEEGPYGRCVWKCDNDVVDHQMVTMNFKNGITANLTMHGHSPFEGRQLRIDGTKGVIIANFMLDDTSIEFIEHGTMKRELLHKETASPEGHGGGDLGLVKSFIEFMQKVRAAETQGKTIEIQGLTGAEESLESHLMAFLSETARLDQKVHSLDEVRP
jgi:predicted dehydrogenase